jgi:hypothetical protein
VTEPVDAARRKARGRSPSYPGIPLGTAIDRARTIYEHEGRHAAPMDAITRHWGYKSPLSGPASVTYAALKKFGLLADEGSGSSRMGKLTPLALDILLHPNPLAMIQEAVLRPPIHRELWEQYGRDLPSDATLRHSLVARGGFTERGFEEFIQNYRESIAFAKLAESDLSRAEESHHNEDGAEPDVVNPEPLQEDPQQGNPQQRWMGRVSGNILKIPIPLVGAPPVTIEGEFPISEAAWAQLIAVLNAMKPGLVIDDGLRSSDEGA